MPANLENSAVATGLEKVSFHSNPKERQCQRMFKVKVKSLSHVRLFATPWTVAYQAPPSVGFFRQEYWSGLPFPSPGDHPNPGTELRSPALQVDALTSEPPRERQPSEWEKIIANQATDKELISKTYKQLLKLNSRAINDPIKKMDQIAKQTFLQRRHTHG